MNDEAMVLAKASYQRLMNEHGYDSPEANEFREGVMSKMVTNSPEYMRMEEVFDADRQLKKRLVRAARLESGS